MERQLEEARREIQELKRLVRDGLGSRGREEEDDDAAAHSEALLKVAKPQLHLIRGIDVSDDVAKALSSKGVPLSVGNYSYGFVRDYAEADPATAIHATAKWTCKPGSTRDTLSELKHWWQMANNHALEHEPGLRRFEVYEAKGELALITHDTFDSTEDLKFHLTKGAANKYKKDIDKIAVPENYYFRGPVEWMIRTYSKFMHLPATPGRRRVPWHRTQSFESPARSFGGRWRFCVWRRDATRAPAGDRPA